MKTGISRMGPLKLWDKAFLKAGQAVAGSTTVFVLSLYSQPEWDIIPPKTKLNTTTYEHSTFLTGSMPIM